MIQSFHQHESRCCAASVSSQINDYLGRFILAVWLRAFLRACAWPKAASPSWLFSALDFSALVSPEDLIAPASAATPLVALPHGNGCLRISFAPTRFGVWLYLRRCSF